MVLFCVLIRLSDYDNIHVYCPGVGADEPLVPNFFQNH